MRTLAVVLLLLLVVALWLLMLRGWRRRARRQSDLPAPQPLTRAPADGVPGVYVSTTSHGDWLDRVNAHGLGARSEVLVGWGPDGLAVQRVGAPSFVVPRTDLVGVRRERGMAGKYVERDGLVVVTWRLGPAELDTGFRTRRAEDAGRLEGAVRAMLEEVAGG